MKTYLVNAFSLQMLNNLPIKVKVEEVSVQEIKGSEFISAIGHKDTAGVLSNILGREVPANRISIKLEKGDVLYVAQLVGGRLPEGATTLPEGFTFKFLKVTLEE